MAGLSSRRGGTAEWLRDDRKAPDGRAGSRSAPHLRRLCPSRPTDHILPPEVAPLPDATDLLVKQVDALYVERNGRLPGGEPGEVQAGV